MRVLAIIFGILTLIIDLFLVLLQIANPVSSRWSYIIVFTICAAGLFYSAYTITKQKRAKKAAELLMNTPLMDDASLSDIAQGKLPTITGTPILLQSGEIAHYYAPATRIITSNKAVGRTGGGAGVRVRVAKGISVGTGGGASQTIYGQVTEKYHGTIILTNKRIIFIHNQKGFECKLPALTAITTADGCIVVQTGTKTYQFSVARQDLFASALSMLIKGH